MSSPKIKAQSQSEGHVTSAFMLYFLKKNTIKHDLATLMLDLVYSCVDYMMYKSMDL